VPRARHGSWELGAGGRALRARGEVQSAEREAVRGKREAQSAEDGGSELVRG
jgi:hypothetical protein